MSTVREICGWCATLIPEGKKHVRNTLTFGDCVELRDDRVGDDAELYHAVMRDVQTASLP